MEKKKSESTMLKLSANDLERRIDDFVKEYLKDKSPETAGTYRRSLNEFQRWFTLDKGAFQFRVEDVERYKTYLSETRGLHQVSISTYLTALRRLCQYLMDIGLLETNPARAVKGNRRPSTHSRSVLTDAEIELLINVVDTSTQIGKRDKAIIYFMLFTGLSEIEVVRANVGDLEQTLMGWYLRVQGKGRTAKDQQVPVEQKVVTCIQEYLSSRTKLHPDAPLFVSHGHRSDGKRLNTRSIRSRINHHLEKCQIKRAGISPHSLTHTAPLLWLNNGMSLEEVRERMRHGTIETTMIYFKKKGLINRSPEELKELGL